MKYLKHFENVKYEYQNQKIQKVFNEIEPLSYILEDEGIQIDVIIKEPHNSTNWISISLETTTLPQKNGGYNRLAKTRYTPKNDTFIQEYLDRVREVCESNGCELAVYAGYCAINWPYDGLGLPKDIH